VVNCADLRMACRVLNDSFLHQKTGVLTINYLP
jgi:hypothetical protein